MVLSYDEWEKTVEDPGTVDYLEDYLYNIIKQYGPDSKEALEIYVQRCREGWIDFPDCEEFTEDCAKLGVKI